MFDCLDDCGIMHPTLKNMGDEDNGPWNHINFLCQSSNLADLHSLTPPTRSCFGNPDCRLFWGGRPRIFWLLCG